MVATCLYVTCRQEKSQHMLIDFSDALQVNVYTLGNCFLKFRRLLGLKLDVIDPALYVYRFAAHLELGEKANAVALTALRIVGRMKRDWIVVGRRPAGICAAALLISSRAHGFHREQYDVTRILRICGMTVNKRLREFECTPSSSLSLEQFHTVDIEAEADPPIYTRNKYREARAKAIQDRNMPLLTSGDLDDPRHGKRKASWRNHVKDTEESQELDELYQKLEKEMKTVNNENKNDSTNGQANIETSIKNSDENRIISKVGTNEAESSQIVVQRNNKVALTDTYSIKYPNSGRGKPLQLPDQALADELAASTQPYEGKIDLTEWKSDMPESDMQEIDKLFRSDNEVAQKEAVFNSLNKDYLLKQEEKKKNELDEATEKTKNGQGKRGRKRKNADGEMTTEEALMASVEAKKTSRKINYDAMSSIFDDDGDFAKDQLEDGAGPGLEAGQFDEELMFASI